LSRTELFFMRTLASVVPELRHLFPSLSRKHPETKKPVVYLDGPAGSQVPKSVIDAISDYYLHHNANSSGHFATSYETNEMMTEAHQAAADWFGCDDPRECIFGANMTSLTLSFSRALSRTWSAGDTILVTQLDHDGNVTPWRLAARDVGVHVDTVEVHRSNATLDEESFQRKLHNRVKLVAFTAASNSVGSITQINKLATMAKEAGAEVYVDAVHWAPHRLIDVKEWNVDYCVCSGYKFFGPHVGMLWGKFARLEEIAAYKLRPSPAHPPGKWMTGTQNFAAIAGVRAAIDYVASLGAIVDDTATDQKSRRDRLRDSFELIQQYETQLAQIFMNGLLYLPRIRVFGITDANRFEHRVPTFAFVVEGMSSADVARYLGERGIYCWHGNYYAVDICEALGQSAKGMVRMGIVHTTTLDEIERVIEELRRLTEVY
jgi:cysteine desulfurase family protein (TIGR01976 family)